jgi:aminoglycoside 3-N-acetyltransferase
LTVSATREEHAVSELLRSAGVPRDGVLFVHSAFRKLATHGFSAEAFIEGLLAYMSTGTLVMPTMTWRVVTPEHPDFDELATPSHVGIIPEIFRLCYASHRSLHPTHSVAALGTRALQLTSGHHLDDTPCSPNSPYGRAGAEDTHILMLGIGLERCTAIHHAEELIAPDVYLQPSRAAEIYRCRDRQGIVHLVRLRRHLKLNRDFPQFEAPLAAKGVMRKGVLAETRWMAVAQRDLLSEVCAALRRDPRAIIAPAGAPVIP